MGGNVEYVRDKCLALAGVLRATNHLDGVIFGPGDYQSGLRFQIKMLLAANVGGALQDDL